MNILSTGVKRRIRKAIGLLLAILMVFSILTINIPSAFAEDEPLPVDQPSETPQPGVTPEPIATPQPSVTPEPTATPQPSVTPEPTATSQSSDAIQTYETGTNGKPDKNSLSSSEKKLSTKLLQLTNEEYIPSGDTLEELMSQMAEQEQMVEDSSASDIPGDSGTSVYVYIQTKKGSDLKMLSNYAKVENTDKKNGLAAAWVDVSMIESLAALDAVVSLREVIPPVVWEGSSLSQGDALLNTNNVRNTFGADGTGIKVGIISDGVDHLASAVMSGDLPGGTSAVQVLSNTVGGDEGTAMLEIVHDLAPGAELYFHDCGNNTIAFNEAITELAQAGCDIICDDIGWLTEPFFEDGSIARHIESIMSTYGLLYVSSAGNAANDHYQGHFEDLGIDLFGDECLTADFSGDGTDPFLYLQVRAHASMIVVMEWNDAFGNSGNDYDLEIYDTDTGNYLGGSYFVQQGSGHDPVEYIVYTNDSSSAQNITVRACKYYDPDTQVLAADKILEIYTYGCYTYPTNTVASDSIFGHPAVPGVLSCGAIDGNSEDSEYGLIENFSSQGPVTMISETRQKPDICGIDGVSVTGAGGFPNPFYGTSAAAPHIAAVAALLKSAFPTESSSNIRKMILDNGADLGISGYDNIYGYGRADALSAIQNGSCQVIFDSQGGSEVDPQRILKGGKINRPSNPSKAGCLFAGWYKEEECINAWDFLIDSVSSDTTLYAKWQESRDKYTISEDGTYDVGDYGDNSQVSINPGLDVTLTSSSAAAFNMQIGCSEGVTLTIDKLNIQCTDESALSFTGSGNNLILIGESSLKSASGKPGIRVEEGTSLEISGSGSVSAVSGSGAAGIGGGSGLNGGSVSVSGGTVYAWGTDSSYDIGSGEGGTGGSLAVSGDSAVLLANGTCAAPVTSTHRLITTHSVIGDTVFGKIKLTDAWSRPVYAYLNSSAVSTLTYDCNGGSGTVPVAVVQYTGTSTKLIKAIDLFKDGHSVASWNTQPDGLGTSYLPDEALTLSGDITLYAIYASFPVTAYNAFDNLGFVPMDSAIDPVQDVMYMTESGGCSLYRVDLTTGEIGYLDFPYKAERLTVKNDKIYVTLPIQAHQYYIGSDGSGYIGVVDAASFSIEKIFEVVPDPYDIEADDEGRVYIGSGSNQNSIISVYDTESEQKIDTAGGFYYMGLLDFNPIYNKLYTISTGLSPRDIEAYEITDGDITKNYNSPYHGDYSMSTFMKISPNGKYIFNGSGNIFTCAPTQSGDMVYAGSLGLSFNSICFDPNNHEFIIANDDCMYICDNDTWAVKSAQDLTDTYKGVYCNSSHFVSLMMKSSGKYYLALDNKTPGLNVKGVTLSSKNMVIMDDETETLTATVTPKYATNSKVTWSSSNESVATVSNGVITGVGGGTAEITVTTEQGGFKDTCNVTVVPYKDCNAYNELWFTPMDSAIDPDRDVMYMTESGGNKLFRIDLNTGDIKYIKFPYKAERLTVKNEKIYVTLPHGNHNPYDFTDGSGSIAIIDAATFMIDKTFNVLPDPYDIEVDSEGRAYIGSGSGQWTTLVVYDTNTEQKIDSVGSFRQRSLLDYNPVYNKLYSITTESSPRDITAYEITDGDITTCYDSPYHGDYSMSTFMEISPDGKYIFNGSGNIFTSAPTKTGDMIYAGSLGLTFNSICFDQDNNEFIVANDNGMYICDDDTWAVKAAQGSKDYYKGIYQNNNHFVSLMMKPSTGKYYLTLDNKTPGLNVKGVTLSPESIILLKDETETLEASVSPKYATNQNVTWSSSNESVATVSNGVVTAVGEGNAVITVTTAQGGFKDTCNVSVVPYQDKNAYSGLWFTPLDSEIDPNRDVLYMTESGGNKLYRVDLNTGGIKYIKFPYKAERLTVKNDKIYVTLPHGVHNYYDFSDGSGSIAIIDAATFTIDKSFDIVPDPYDIEVDSAGRAYISPGSGQWSILTVYDTKTGQQIDSVDGFNDRSLLDFNPVYNKLYSVTTDSSPTSITACEIIDGDITACYGEPNSNSMSAYMKISPDGQFIFNGSGNIFTCAPTRTGDMVFTGTLGSPYTSIYFDTSGNRMYTCNANTLKVYAYDTRNLISTMTSADQFISMKYSDEKITALQKNSSGVYYLKDYSTKCLLANLSIDGTLVSGFSPISQDCNITIPTNNDTINISASALETQNQVSGDLGIQPLNLGVNTYTITVTSTITEQTKTYTLKVTRNVPGNANLSAISTSAGTLSPVFDKDTQSYTLSLDENTESVNISPVKEDGLASYKINGMSVTSWSISVNNGSSADFVIEVTAKDKITKKTYTVHVVRAISTNANLYSLTSSAGTLTPAFDAGIYEYSVSIPSNASYTQLYSSKASSAATVRFNGLVTTSTTVSLAVGQTKDVVIEVTAQDGVTVKTYTVHVNKALSNNANLSNIALSSGTLSQTFNENTTEYTVTLPSTVTGTTITPAKANTTSLMTIDGESVTAKTVSLGVGESQDVVITLTAQDGVSSKTYTVNVTRSPANNANLSGMSITSGTLSPVFSASTTEYNLALLCTVNETTITPVKADSAAAMKMNRFAVPSFTVAPMPGQTKDVIIEVNSQDGLTKKNYIIHATRAPYSNNASLSAMSLSNGTLSPAFDAGTLEYNVVLPSNTSSTKISPTKADSTATMMIDGSIASYKYIYPNKGETTDVNIEVTAQDGVTAKKYTVHVSRPVSNNANLSGISLSTGTLSPAFNINTIEYNVALASNVTGTTITPAKADSTAVMIIDGSIASSKSVSLNKGETKNIVIEVTAQDGVTKKAYTIHITRALYSSNANLSGISLSTGTLSPTFSANTVEYSVALLNTVSGTTISSTKADSTATTKIDGAAVSSKAITINPGQTIDVIIDVTAQDGTTKKTYTVHVTRAVSSNANLSGISLSNGTLSPAFNTNTVEYNVNLSGVAGTTITPAKADNTATTKIDGTAATSTAITLNTGQTKDVVIEVTAQDGVTVKTYTVHVTRAMSSNANLSGIWLSNGTLAPVFSASTVEYSVALSNAVTGLTIAPAKDDSTASVKINGAPASSIAITLNPGQKRDVVIEVTAQDGITIKTYTVHIERAISSNANIDVNTNNTSYGAVYGGGWYTKGDIVSITASPYAGYRFVRWLQNGIELSRSSRYEFTAVGDVSFTAEFAHLSPISVSYTKQNVRSYNGSDGTISLSASGGDSGRYQYSINGGAFRDTGYFSNLTAGTYSMFVRDANYPENTASCIITIDQPDFVGSVPANKVSSQAAVDTAITVMPPAAPKGYAPQSVTFTTSNPSVASVDANGNVTFLAGGKVTIITKVVSQTVDKKGKVKTKITTVKKTITVKQLIDSITLNMNDATIARTQKLKLSASFNPITASNKKVKWISSNPKVASVSGSGVVTGKSGGTAIITCKALDGSNVSANCTVTVTPVYPASVKLSKPSLVLKIGKSAALKATVGPISTDFKTITWTSSNPAIAAVDAKGKIKALSSGTAVITATTSNGISTTCTVIVQ